jgi:hypothetical protein
MEKWLLRVGPRDRAATFVIERNGSPVTKVPNLSDAIFKSKFYGIESQFPVFP